MALNTSGAVLEGVRLSSSCNTYIYPPRNFIQDTDESAFQSVTSRADYCVWVSGQTIGTQGLEIASDSLAFRWTKNDAIFRFDYDSSNKRFFPAPGSSPTKIGVISNEPRLVVPIPVPGSYDLSPYSLFVGSPRIFTFNISIVDISEFTTTPPVGTVQISSINGQCNFNPTDLNNALYKNQSVYVCRQSFFDRTKNSGLVASIDASGNYLAYLNPIPGQDVLPLVKVGNRPYLSVTAYPTETSLPIPTAPNSAVFARDTGKLLISQPTLYVNESIFYDGVFLGEVSPQKYTLNTVNNYSLVGNVFVGNLDQFVGVTDPTRWIFYGSKSGKSNYYLLTLLGEEIPTSISTGHAFINTTTGDVYISSSDSYTLLGYTVKTIDSYLKIDDLVTFQIYRSAINTSGPEIVPDFIEYYRATDSTVVDSLAQSPFILLPVKPLQTSYLSFNVAASAGGSGTYVGPLYPASDSSKLGYSYSIDYSNARMSLYNRVNSTKSLEKASSNIKLDNAAIYDSGIVASLDGIPVDLGEEFDVNYSSGSVQFLSTVGEDDALNRNNLSGTVDSVTTLSSSSEPFISGHVGSYVYIANGTNAGFYKIISVINSRQARVESPFPVTGDVTFSIKATREQIYGSIWETVKPPFSNFKLYRAPNSSSSFSEVPQSEYSIVASSGQVTMTSPIEIGQVFKADYISQDTSDDGITISNNPHSEILRNKISYEAATYNVNTRVVEFNSEGLTVLPEYGFIVTVNGSSTPYTAGDFVSPNKLNIDTLLTTQKITVTYYVSENPGGRSTLNTSRSPLVVDFPTFTAGSSTAILNGDQRGKIYLNSPILLDKIAYTVNSISYDTSADKTTLGFTTPIQITYSGQFDTSDALEFETVTLTSTSIPRSSTGFVVVGDKSTYKNRILKINEDPYYVTSANFDSSAGKTTLTLLSTSLKNYVLPSFSVSTSNVIYPSDTFNTLKNAYTVAPYVLFLKASSSRELTDGIDYTISDGGSIKLTSKVVRGESLFVCYVARDIKPSGTTLKANYAYAIAPDLTNGISGQTLKANFDVYSPDSFYYRYETILDYVPEVSASINSGSSTPGGPTLSAPPSRKLKDNGSPSLYFDEQKYGNLDQVAIRLLFYYNELVNKYEDLISNMDGRVVGGTSGKFRFDGLPGSIRNSTSQITNDIDDLVFNYDNYELTSFFVIEKVPHYIKLYEYGSKSRIFPTRKSRNFVINALTTTDDRDQVIANFGQDKLTSLSVVNSAIASLKFSRIGDKTIIVPSNGDSTTLNPQLVVNQPVKIYDGLGKYYVSTTVSSITGSSPVVLTLNDSVPILVGSIVSDNQAIIPTVWQENRFYFPDTDFNVNYETGDLINCSYQFLIDLNFQRELHPNEILVSTADYSNTSTSPARLPVLDGSSLADNGFTSIPVLHRNNEQDILNREQYFLSDTTNRSTVAMSSTADVIFGGLNMNLTVGDILEVLTGPYSGSVFSVINSISPTQHQISPAFPSFSSGQFKIIRKDAYDNYKTDLSILIGVLSTNVGSPITAGSLIGTVNSELKVLDDIIRYMGETSSIQNGSISGNTLSGSFSGSGLENSGYIYIDQGSNIGLYKIASSTSSSITIATEDPFYGFTTNGSVSFRLITKYPFMTESGPAFLASYLKSTYSFNSSTVAWYSNINLDNASARLNVVYGRLGALAGYIPSVESVLKSGDSLYNKRYLWISQRTDKRNGFLTSKVRATQNRLESTAKLISDQQKNLELATM